MRRDFVARVIWRAGGLIGRQVFTVLFGIMLARLLGPEAFGVVAMATIFLGFVALLNDFGIGSALIRVKDSELGQVERSTIFWFALLLSSALGAICAACGVALGRFYDEPQLPMVVALLSLTLPINGLAMMHNLTLVRALRFQTLAFIDLAAVVIGGTVGVVLAWRGAGLWALVVQNLLTSLVSCALHWACVRFWPSLRFERSALRGHLRKGMHLMLSEMVIFVGRSLDNVLVGRLFGSAPLALYSRAYSFLYLELYGIRTVVSVLFPTLAATPDDVPRTKSAILRVSGIVALITWPCAIGLALVADPFVRAVFDESWVGMIPLLRVLAPVGVWQSVTGLERTLYQLAGRTDLQLRTVTLTNVFCIVFMVAATPWGPVGIALGYAIASILIAYWTFRLALGLVGASLTEVLREVRGVGLCCVPLALGCQVGRLLPNVQSPWLELLIAVGAGGAAYLVAVMLLRPAPYRHLMDSARAFRAGRAQAAQA
jgi:O-antigen/teichoic acid export membrane protein